jgi:predicted transcriptional regulator
MRGEQIKAARMMLGITAQDLAALADVSVPTVQRMDSAKGPVPGRYETVQKVTQALEAKGIQFLDEGDTSNGVGVALQWTD